MRKKYKIILFLTTILSVLGISFFLIIHAWWTRSYTIDLNVNKLKFETKKQTILFPESTKASKINLEVDGVFELHNGQIKNARADQSIISNPTCFTIQTLIIPANANVEISRHPSGNSLDITINGRSSKVHIFTCRNQNPGEPNNRPIAPLVFTASETMNLSFYHEDINFGFQLSRDIPFEKIQLGKYADIGDHYESFQTQPVVINSSLFPEMQPWQTLAKENVILPGEPLRSKITLFQIPPGAQDYPAAFDLRLKVQSSDLYYRNRSGEKFRTGINLFGYAVKKLNKFNILVSLGAAFTLATTLLRLSKSVFEIEPKNTSDSK